MILANLVDPFAKANGAPPKTLWAFFRWTLKGAGPAIAFAALLSAFAGSFEVVSALILGRVVDLAATGDPLTFLSQNWATLLAFVGFFLILRPLSFGASSYASSVLIGPNVTPLVLSRLNRWTLNQPVTFFDNDFAGRIAQKQMQTSRAITDVAMEVVNVVAFALASVVGSVLLLTSIDGRIALVLVFWFLGYLFLLRWFLPRIRTRSKARAAARAAVTGQVVDAISNIKTVKLFAHDDHEDQAAIDAMRSFRGTALRFGSVSAAFRLCLMTLAGTLPVMLIGGSVLLWKSGLASPGDIAAAGAVSVRLAQMTGWVSFTLLAMYANIGEIEDGMRTLTPEPTVRDAADAKPFAISLGTIDFEAVSYRYGRQSGGISDISLHLKPGEKLGVVGASGAGKSTLVSLLLRLYEPESGRILVDGEDIARIPQKDLRAQISMVTQDTGLFNRSALDNIKYGTPGASLAKVKEAAQRAQALEFIEDLKDHNERIGFDAHLGERGVKLSGGQRQRIALARAILKDAPILVLDEATSALDSESEALIQEALHDAMVGKTVISIAHRLSTLTNMDRIIVLENGKIAESGTHSELLDLNGSYARYWAKQSGGFLGVNEAAE